MYAKIIEHEFEKRVDKSIPRQRLMIKNSDPRGIFVNPYLARVRFLSSHLAMGQQYIVIVRLST